MDSRASCPWHVTAAGWAATGSGHQLVPSTSESLEAAQSGDRGCLCHGEVSAPPEELLVGPAPIW